MNVLVVAPHPDDESIGVGGTLALHGIRGDRVTVAFLTSGELGMGNTPAYEASCIREGEAGHAAAVLGVGRLEFLRGRDWFLGDDPGDLVPRLVDLLREEVPGRLYLPHPNDWHPDHKAAIRIVVAALGELRVLGEPLDAELFGYEVWTPMSEWDHVEDVSEVIDVKLAAIACYVSQRSVFDYARAATGLAQYRGALAGRCDHAEVFSYIDIPESAP
jgi:N-acetylglucosamine malate deacetylase 1